MQRRKEKSIKSERSPGIIPCGCFQLFVRWFEKENSLNETQIGRRQSRLFNNSFNADNVADEPAQTPTQLVDLYQKTVELATQGKINIKNAFSIPLVERLPQVLNVIALDDKENHRYKVFIKKR